MTRYADPERCPDCLGPITYGAQRCPGCGLSLTGDLAGRLFVTLSAADRLLKQLRGGSAPATAAAMPAGPTRLDGPPPIPMPPVPPVPPRRRLSGASVPKVLLTLGAGCVLIAALVFLAVTWSALGVAGRTAVLLTFTAIAGGLTVAVARRGLRGAAESLDLVTIGLVVLDAFGARHAGWFGSLGTPGFTVLVGGVLLVLGTAAATAARRTTVGALVGAQGVAPVGSALVGIGLAASDWMPDDPALVLAVLVAAGAAALAWRLRLTIAAWGGAGVTVVAWVALFAHGAGRAVEHSGYPRLWGRLEVWPLLVAAIFAAAPALASAFPKPVRVGGVAVGWTVLAGVALVPYLHGSESRLVLAVVVVLAVTAALVRMAPGEWSLAGAPVQLLGGVGLLAASLRLLGDAAERVGAVVDPSWAGRVGDTFPSTASQLAPWLLPVCLVALLVSAATLVPAVVGFASAVDGSASAYPLPTVHNPDLQLGVTAAGLVVAGATLVLYPTPVWATVALGCLGAVGYVAWWLRLERALPLGLAAGAVTGAVVVSVHTQWLTVVALAGLSVLAGTVHLRARGTTTAAVAGAALVAGLGGETWTVGALAHVGDSWVSLAGLLLFAAMATGTSYLPDTWWRAGDGPAARTGIEVGAAAGAVPMGLAGILLAPDAAQLVWAAIFLTAAGATVAVIALVRADRRALAVPGGVLLALASWVRLWDIGVHAPEAYTLPTAAVLVAVGLHRLLRVHRLPGERTADTMTALAPGLGLALAPSLLWSLAEPHGLRPLLLGLACFALVLAGIRLRWTAPLMLGSVVGGLLVLRLGAPYVAGAVPRWVLIGMAGAVLIGLGVTWERRLRDARAMRSYVRALR